MKLIVCSAIPTYKQRNNERYAKNLEKDENIDGGGTPNNS